MSVGRSGLSARPAAFYRHADLIPARWKEFAAPLVARTWAPAQPAGTAGQFAGVATVSTLCTYTDSVKAGTYYYQVAGFNPNGSSPYCTPVTGVVQ